METTTVKEVEGAMPTKNDFEYVRALDEQGNPIRISKADVAKVLEELLPIVSPSRNGLAPKEIGLQFINTQSRKSVFLHKSEMGSWSGFSFILTLASGTSGSTIIHICGGIGADISSARCNYKIISSDGEFSGYAKIMYRINANKIIEVYLVHSNNTPHLYARDLYKINLKTRYIDGNMQLLDIDESGLKEANVI